MSSSIPEPKIGFITFSSYLWTEESERGETEGRKNRPVYIVDVEDIVGTKAVTVLPITHTPPGPGQHAVEIPAATHQRAGLDGERCWIVCDEANEFTWPGYDLFQNPRSGKFEVLPAPGKLFDLVKEKIAAARTGLTFKAVNRDA